MKMTLVLFLIAFTQISHADILGYYVGQLKGEKSSQRCSVAIYTNKERASASNFALADYVVNGKLETADLAIESMTETNIAGYQECDQRVLDLALKNGVVTSFKYRNNSSCGFIPKIFRSSGECINLQKQSMNDEDLFSGAAD